LVRSASLERACLRCLPLDRLAVTRRACRAYGFGETVYDP
jgi:hypothetical protein